MHRFVSLQEQTLRNITSVLCSSTGSTVSVCLVLFCWPVNFESARNMGFVTAPKVILTTTAGTHSRFVSRLGQWDRHTQGFAESASCSRQLLHERTRSTRPRHPNSTTSSREDRDLDRQRSQPQPILASTPINRGVGTPCLSGTTDCLLRDCGSVGAPAPGNGSSTRATKPTGSLSVLLALATFARRTPVSYPEQGRSMATELLDSSMAPAEGRNT